MKRVTAFYVAICIAFSMCMFNVFAVETEPVVSGRVILTENRSEADKTSGDWKYTVSTKNNATITSYNGDATSVVVPETLGGYPVIRIGDSAFAFCDVEQVTLNSNLKYIDEYAFAFCHYLKSIAIPDRVVNVGNYAFQECKRLKTVVIGKNVQSIGNSAFQLAESNSWYSLGAASTPAEIYFTGNVPEMHKRAFRITTANVHYPKENASWVKSVRVNYGGTLTWSSWLRPVSVSSVENTASTAMKVAWKAVSGVAGYEIQYATSSKFTGAQTVTLLKQTTVKKTITELTKGKTYYVRMRTYSKINGIKYYSGWSEKVSVKITK